MGEASFTDLLHEVRANTLEAYGHQEVPFEKVVEAVVKERDLSRSPIFQVLFVLRNTPEVPELEMNGIRFSREPNKHTTALFDISLFITETPHGLSCSLEYCTDLFTEATMARLATHFKTLLASVVNQPQEKIGLLPLLGKEEEQQLLEGFNATAAAYPQDKTITELFEDKVKETPGSHSAGF